MYLANAGANVALETTPTVNGHHVTIDGTTDLPDGTRLGVQVFQFDAWSRARPPARRGSGLRILDDLEAIVHDGRFSVRST